MHIVVCIKQVPDSAQIRVHPVTNTIMRQGVPAIVNPYDLFALEEALRLKDQFGGRITMLCMGPPQAEDALRKCISFGASAAILVTDRAFAGADTLATSYALAAAIRKIGQEQAVDLLFTGKQTIDGDTAQVGPGIAKRLGLNLLTHVSKVVEVDLDGRRLKVERRAEGGVQLLETTLHFLDKADAVAAVTAVTAVTAVAAVPLLPPTRSHEAAPGAPARQRASLPWPARATGTKSPASAPRTACRKAPRAPRLPSRPKVNASA